MAWSTFHTVALILIIAAASGFLVAAGWIPWTVPVAVFVLALVVAGVRIFRAR